MIRSGTQLAEIASCKDSLPIFEFFLFVHTLVSCEWDFVSFFSIFKISIL